MFPPGWFPKQFYTPSYWPETGAGTSAGSYWCPTWSIPAYFTPSFWPEAKIGTPAPPPILGPGNYWNTGWSPPSYFTSSYWPDHQGTMANPGPSIGGFWSNSFWWGGDWSPIYWAKKFTPAPIVPPSPAFPGGGGGQAFDMESIYPTDQMLDFPDYVYSISAPQTLPVEETTILVGTSAGITVQIGGTLNSD